VDVPGRTKIGAPPKPRPIPAAPTGRINITDPDSRPVKTARGFLQGYTAQAVATEGQIVIAADVITGGNERHRLEPMVTAAREELQAAGITDAPEVVLADAGFWNSPHIEALAHDGLRALVKPDADSRKAPTRARSGPAYQRMRELLARDDVRSPTWSPCCATSPAPAVASPSCTPAVARARPARRTTHARRRRRRLALLDR
jgi:hypothetical protein